MSFTAKILDQNGDKPVRGDSISVTRTVTEIPDADTIATAWLTIKANEADADNEAALQLQITTTESSDGHVTNEGDGVDGEVRFDIADADGDYTSITAGTSYKYDIQVKTTAGLVRTIEKGTVTWLQDITQTSS